ncbi:hypothetical protein [Actinomadura rayongensis]|uniref:Fibronectin type-III domain-containing protein n=1 Tax=Actinomadura rayongensis TaxID=1429076 RepID=A0A6I4WAE0_9ACTN|nr:hypothetical protein [Actinomadura rayongensis]MXQ65255.1 hypothetical protein [Actinomadura rayongensis]
MLVAPLAMGIPVFVGAAPASAATAVTAPANGAIVRSGSSVTAKATFDGSFVPVSGELHVTTPAGGDILVDRGMAFLGPASLSGNVDIRRNGKYTLTVRRAGRTASTSTFTVRIPPARPSGLSATAAGGKLKVSWARGGESDINGYNVNASGVGSQSGGVSKFCSGAACSATFAVGTTGTVKVSVLAKRPNGMGGTVSSAAASTSVTIKGGTGGGGGGSAPLPTSGAVPPLPTTGNAPQTPLTNLNGQSPVTLPSVQPDGATPGYAYPAPQVAGQSTPTADNAVPMGPIEWSRNIGIALVLLVIAAHLGMWTRRLRVAQAGVSSKGMAARMARSGTGRRRVSKTRESISEAETLARTAVLTLGKPKGAADAKPAADTEPAPTGMFRKPEGDVKMPRFDAPPEKPASPEASAPAGPTAPFDPSTPFDPPALSGPFAPSEPSPLAEPLTPPAPAVAAPQQPNESTIFAAAKPAAKPVRRRPAKLGKPKGGRGARPSRTPVGVPGPDDRKSRNEL